MVDLTDRWIVVHIGKKKYVINYSYVIAFTDLRSAQFVNKSRISFVRGVYKALGYEIYVLDGSKIFCEDDNKKKVDQFCRTTTDIKIDIESYINLAEVAIPYREDLGDLLSKYTKIVSKLESIETNNDRYVDRQIKKIIGRVASLRYSIEALADKFSHKDKSLDSLIDDIYELKSNNIRYINDIIDELNEYYSNSISDMCMIISIGDSRLGLTIDSIEYIDADPSMISKNKKSTMSAGTLRHRGTEYNIMDISKLKGVIE